MKRIYIGERRQGSSFIGLRSWLLFSLLCISVLVFACQSKSDKPKIEALSTPPTVTQINADGLRDLLKPRGKPLLINFWATWCGPCREEFPDLVEIARDHKDKVDTITISLDSPADIDGEVAKFLAEMGSDSTAYLLKTADESEAIDIVSKDWQGGLPYTILFNAQGEKAYAIQGKFKTNILVAEIEKL